MFHYAWNAENSIHLESDDLDRCAGIPPRARARSLDHAAAEGLAADRRAHRVPHAAVPVRPHDWATLRFFVVRFPGKKKKKIIIQEKQRQNYNNFLTH